MFFTTHNTDILDLPLPKHSFTFLKKDSLDGIRPIKCIDVSQYLKHSTDSLKNAVDNDLFSAAPSVDYVYKNSRTLKIVLQMRRIDGKKYYLPLFCGR